MRFLRASFKNLSLGLIPALTFLLVGAPAPAWAEASQHIVFNLEGVLVQAVPRGKALKMDPSQVITIGNYSYRVEPYAREVLEALSKRPDVDISIYSDLKKDQVNAILAAFKLPGGKTLDKVAVKSFGGEDMALAKGADSKTKVYQGDVARVFRKDLSKVASSTDNVVLIDTEANIAVDGQEKSVLNAGPSRYFFESFADAREAASGAQKEDAEKFKHIERYFPKSEKEWKDDHEKLLKAYLRIDTALNEKGGKPLADRLKSVPDSPTLSKAKRAEFAELSAYTAWKYSADKSRVVGCVKKSHSVEDYEVSVAKSDCASSLPTRAAWASATSTTCVLKTADGVMIDSTQQSKCLTDELTTFDWKDEAAQSCARYTVNHVYLASAAADECGGPIEKDLRKMMKTVPHSTYVYHYVTHSRLALETKQSGPVDPQNSTVRDHVRKWADYFNEPKRALSENAGLYLANDPLLTYPNYGGADFVMYRINFPKGMRFLDNRENSPFSAEAVAQLKKDGCNAYRLQDLIGSGNPGVGISQACAVASSKYMKALHIAHIVYRYNIGNVPECDSREQIAYVLTRPELVPNSNLEVFTPTPAASGAAHEEAVMISKMADRVGSANPYSSLRAESKAISDDDYKAWLGRHIQGCEKLAPVEPPKPEPKAVVQAAKAAPCVHHAKNVVSGKVTNLHTQTKKILSKVK